MAHYVPRSKRHHKHKKGAHFIQGAIKHPGALHADLGVPQGQKIPRSRIEAAAHGHGKTAQRARLALTLSRMHRS